MVLMVLSSTKHIKYDLLLKFLTISAIVICYIFFLEWHIRVAFGKFIYIIYLFNVIMYMLVVKV